MLLTNLIVSHTPLSKEKITSGFDKTCEEDKIILLIQLTGLSYSTLQPKEFIKKPAWIKIIMLFYLIQLSTTKRLQELKPSWRMLLTHPSYWVYDVYFILWSTKEQVVLSAEAFWIMLLTFNLFLTPPPTSYLSKSECMQA
jgi:hypothetical protein